MYYDIWDSVKNGSFVSTHQVGGVVENIPREVWTKEDKEKVQHSLKVKTIITIDPSIDEFLHVSHYETTKEIWNTLQLSHEGKIGVKQRLVLTHWPMSTSFS